MLGNSSAKTSGNHWHQLHLPTFTHHYPSNFGTGKTWINHEKPSPRSSPYMSCIILKWYYWLLTQTSGSSMIQLLPPWNHGQKYQLPREKWMFFRFFRLSFYWLVVYLPIWKIWKSVGIIIPNIWKNKTSSKPPTTFLPLGLSDTPENNVGYMAFPWFFHMFFLGCPTPTLITFFQLWCW